MSDIESLLLKLLKTEIRKPRNTTFEQNQEYEKYINKSFTFLLRLLSSSLGYQRVDVDQINGKILEGFSSSMNETVLWNQLFNRFTKSPYIRNKSAILHVLKRISEHRSQMSVAQYQGARTTMVDEEEENEGEDDQILGGPIHQRNVLPSRILSSQPNSGSQQPVSQDQLEAHRGFQANTQDSISDAVLLRDVLYTFQGIDGQFVKYNNFLNGFAVIKEVGVSPNTRDTIRRIGELGWLYIKINDFVTEVSQDVYREGLILQSFVSSLDLQISEYLQFVTKFETQISDLSLRKLLFLCPDYLQKLKILSILVDGCRDKKGGELVSALWKYSQHGDTEIKKLVSSILSEVTIPLFHMLKKWLFEGELIDPFHELFIIKTSASEITSSSSGNAKKLPKWETEFRLNEKMIPCFFDRDLAEKILRIGKSVHFLREYRTAPVREKNNYFFKTPSSSSSFSNENELSPSAFTFNKNYVHSLSKYMRLETMNEFSVLVGQICEKIDQELLKLVFRKYHFMEHLHAFQKYFLFGQGDFIQMLMKIIGGELNKPTFQIDKFALPGLIIDAIRSSNAKFEPEYVKDCLSVILFPATAFASSSSEGGAKGRTSSIEMLGWETFSLYYRIEDPLNNIWNRETILQYQKIFRFLWKIKRIDRMLGMNWKKLNIVLKECQNKGIYQILSLVHPTTTYRHKMNLFVNDLQYYYLFEKIEKEWRRVVRKTMQIRPFINPTKSENEERKRRKMEKKALKKRKMVDEEIEGEKEEESSEEEEKEEKEEVVFKKDAKRKGNRLKNFDYLIKIHREFPLRIIEQGDLTKGNETKELILRILGYIQSFLENQKQMTLQIRQLIIAHDEEATKMMMRDEEEILEELNEEDDDDDDEEDAIDLNINALMKTVGRLKNINKEFLSGVRELEYKRPKMLMMFD